MCICETKTRQKFLCNVFFLRRIYPSPGCKLTLTLRNTCFTERKASSSCNALLYHFNAVVSSKRINNLGGKGSKK